MTYVVVTREEISAAVNRAVVRCPTCRGRDGACQVCATDRELLDRLKKLPAIAASMRAESFTLCWCNHKGTCYPCRVSEYLRQ